MKLTATMFMTLDGVVQAPGQAPGGRPEDPSDGFELGGWTLAYGDEDFQQLTVEEFGHADAFLFGRRTYDIFSGYWPDVTDPDDPLAARLNSRPKHIASRSPQALGWPGAVQLKGDVVEAVQALKDQPGDELQVHGSGMLLRSLWDANLVDEWRIRIFPVVLGSGRQLFGTGRMPGSLRLVDSRTTPSGITALRYARP